MKLETITLSISEIIPIVAGFFICIWGLIKLIYSGDKEDFLEHKRKCEEFQKNQEIHNEHNSNFRHKYKDFDKQTATLVAQTEKNLSDKIESAVKPMNENIKLILEHVLKRNER